MATLKNACPLPGSDPTEVVLVGSKIRVGGALFPKKEFVVQRRTWGSGCPVPSRVWNPTKPYTQHACNDLFRISKLSRTLPAAGGRIRKPTSSWAVWQRLVPAGIGSLAYTMGEIAADKVGEAWAGGRVGPGTVTEGLATVCDGFTALVGEGVHAATASAANPVTSPNRPWGTIDDLSRSNGASRRT